MSDPGRSPSPWPVALILVLAATLRIAGLGHENFWIDEVFQIHRARTPLAFPVQFLQILPTAAMLQLGESEFLLRLPSALFSIADVGVLYLLARRLYDESAALLASLFLALSPMHIWYAQETRWYSEWSLVTVLSYLALVGILQRGRVRSWAAYAALSAFNLYLFLLSIVVIACQGITTAALLLRRRFGTGRALRAAAGIAAAIVLAAPFLINLLAGPGGPTGFPRPTRLVVLPYSVFVYAAGFSVGPSVRELHFFPAVERILRDHPEVLGYGVVFGPLLAIGLWRIIRSGSPRPEILVPWVVGLPLLVFAAALITRGTYNVRYTFAALPAITLALALGVRALPRRWPSWVATGLVVLGFAYSLRNYYFDPDYDKEDVRGAVRYVGQSKWPDAPFAWAGRIGPPIAYYGGELDTVRFLECDPTTGRVVTDPDWSLRPEQPVWFAVGRDWDRVAPSCLEWLRRTHVVVDSVHLAGVELRALSPLRDATTF